MKTTLLVLLSTLLLAACRETPPPVTEPPPPPPVTEPSPLPPPPVTEPPPPEEITVTVSAAPVTGDAPLEVTFTAEANGYTGEYLWEFGDDTSLYGGATQTHTYRTPGSYLASASVGNSEDLETSYVTITVEDPEAGRDRTP